MGASRGGVSLLLVLIVTLPGALASSASGGFRIKGELSLPPHAESNVISPLAIYSEDTSQLGFRMMAPLLHVRLFQSHSYQVPPLLSGPSLFGYQDQLEERSWTLTNATLSLADAGENHGILGFYPARAAAAEIVSSATMEIESRLHSTIPPNHTAVTDTPDFPLYRQDADEPHLHARTPCMLTYTGPGALKVNGLDLHLKSDENETVIRTGEDHPSDAELVYTWLYLEFDSGTVALDSPTHPLEIAGTEANLAWDGIAWMTPKTGELATAGVTYSPRDGRTSIDGNFTATLAPSRVAGESDLLNLRGDLRATSLVRYERAPVAPFMQASNPWIMGLIAGALILCGAVLAVVAVQVRRHHPPPRSGVRALEERASIEEERRDFAAAAEWLRRARRINPRIPGLALREGFNLFMAGQHRAALELLEQAAKEREDGEAELWSAHCALRLGDADAAERFLLHALDRRPSWDVLVQIAQDTAFAGLRERPNFQAAIERAGSHFPDKRGD